MRVMRWGTRLLLSAFVMTLGCALSTSWAQEGNESKGPETPPAAEKPADKPEEKPGEVPAVKPEEKPAEKPVAAPVEPFADVLKKWNALDAQLSEISQQYAVAPSREERDALRSRYEKLVLDSEKLLPSLRASAEAAFVAAPGKDPEVNKILIGLVAYEYRRDDYPAALKLAQTLIDGKVEEPVLLAIAGMAAFRADDYETAEKHLKVAQAAKKLDPEGQEALAQIPGRKELWEKELAIRAKETESGDLPRVEVETTKGKIVIELFENEAPQSVANFISLVESKFYDGKTFHRVLPGFMAQGGCPKGDGSGGPGYEIYCECHQENYRHHFQGSLSMAHAGRDTGGSQFFLTFRGTPHLDGRHTCFGRIVEGMDVLPKLQRRDPSAVRPAAPDKIVKATVVRKREHEYKPTKVVKPGDKPAGEEKKPGETKEPAKKEPDTKEPEKKEPEAKGDEKPAEEKK